MLCELRELAAAAWTQCPSSTTSSQPGRTARRRHLGMTGRRFFMGFQLREDRDLGHDWSWSILGQSHLVTTVFAGANSRDSQPDELNLVAGIRPNPSTWEEVSLSDYALPPETDFLLLEIGAIENVYNDSTSPEFDGHYADQVELTLTIVPEPANAMILALPLLGLKWRRRGL